MAIRIGDGDERPEPLGLRIGHRDPLGDQLGMQGPRVLAAQCHIG